MEQALEAQRQVADVERERLAVIGLLVQHGQEQDLPGGDARHLAAEGKTGLLT